MDFVRRIPRGLFELTLMVAAVIGWGSLNISGVCWSEGGYLSDEEMFRRVVISIS